MVTGGFLYPMGIYLRKAKNENSNVFSEMPFSKNSNRKSIDWFLYDISF